MATGMIMIKAQPGLERSVYGVLKENIGIRSIHHAFGDYDFFAIIAAENICDLEIIIENIRGLNEVMETRAIVTKVEEPHLNYNPLQLDSIESNTASCS